MLSYTSIPQLYTHIELLLLPLLLLLLFCAHDSYVFFIHISNVKLNIIFICESIHMGTYFSHDCWINKTLYININNHINKNTSQNLKIQRIESISFHFVISKWLNSWVSQNALYFPLPESYYIWRTRHINKTSTMLTVNSFCWRQKKWFTFYDN